MFLVSKTLQRMFWAFVCYPVWYARSVSGPEVERLAAMAAKYKVHLVMGVIERDGYTLYCTVLFFDPQGHFLGKHRKVMPTALERIIWGFGDGSTIPVFDTPVGKIGAAICWENRMPLLRTAMYAKGCFFTLISYDVCQSYVLFVSNTFALCLQVLKYIVLLRLIQETYGKLRWPTLPSKEGASCSLPTSSAEERIIRLRPIMFSPVQRKISFRNLLSVLAEVS